jgi:tetratricopeptide (TPR) repeat protein
MSLLIKALKKAEKRHQEATAHAIEQVSADPTMNAAAEAASQKVKPSMQHEMTAPIAKAANAVSSAIPELAAPDAWRVDAAPALASVSESPVITEGSFAAMSLSLSPGDTAEPVALAPGSDTPLQAPVEMAPTAPLAQAAAPLSTPAPQVAPGSVPISQPIEVAAAAKAQAPAPAKPAGSKTVKGAQLSGMAVPGWMQSRWVRIGAVGSIAVAAAGGWLAWQMMAPGSGVTAQQALTPPMTMPPLGEVTPPKAAEKTEGGAGAVKGSPRVPRLQASEGESGARPVLRSGTGPAIRGGGARELASGDTSAKVGPSLAMLSPSDSAGSGLPRLGSAAGSALEPKVELSAQPRSAPPTAPAASGPGASNSGPRLIRQDNGEKVARLLDQAFASLSKQDRRTARQLYEQALELDRLNVDAIVGLASISARDGDAATAERLYSRVLELDPNDAAARAGLSSLRLSADPAGQESQLRHLLASDPAQPALQFALGNSLSMQGRWTDAQQAYFQAFSGDTLNPDYAFNLAIALERVRQPALAASYYRKALELAQKRPARFNADQARSRLTVIDKGLQPQAAAVIAPGEAPPKD